MVSKCANPACATRFLYLHEGRVFVFRPAGSNSGPEASVERYWLCGACLETMTLVNSGGTVVLRPRRKETTPTQTANGKRLAHLSAA